MIVGYILALLAALASGSGSVLESIGVRRAGAFGGTALDLVHLRRQWIYFLGIGVDLVGFACAAAALQRLPLFLVQSVLAFSVGVTAAITAFMGTRLAAAGWVALGVGAVGLVLLGLSAQPGPAKVLPSEWRWVLPAMALVVGAIAWYFRRFDRPWAAQVLGFATGVGFSMVGVSARTLELPSSGWAVLAEPAVWGMILNGLAAAVAFALALQKGGATAVNAIMFTTNTALSSVVGLVFLDDRVRDGFTAFTVAGLILAMSGAIVTAHYASQAKEPSGSERDSARR
ncbi:hypothetical protein [Amycolatopsis sp. BJA-103]|uniref:hypothetical protein n=1 Tax=Amycolatopsis sp. BJA-103 TaxID=1911175 RepID=UPI000C78AAB6|nr:hypothetical protein [Amycolatopsis sp. BJA-103]AUI59135.1 hypothetical protein BKN51_13555 [Amycolatopsis sp. BJA-103]PNE17417.1 hypothetical protein B1H26_20970 [Amycolatopsis sp. BJA-103]